MELNIGTDRYVKVNIHNYNTSSKLSLSLVANSAYGALAIKRLGKHTVSIGGESSRGVKCCRIVHRHAFDDHNHNEHDSNNGDNNGSHDEHHPHEQHSKTKTPADRTTSSTPTTATITAAAGTTVPNGLNATFFDASTPYCWYVVNAPPCYDIKTGSIIH
jgi:hypothetical protein